MFIFILDAQEIFQILLKMNNTNNHTNQLLEFLRKSSQELNYLLYDPPNQDSTQYNPFNVNYIPNYYMLDNEVTTVF